jgi:tetratricopeptide (TPR) repeat protein
VDVFYPPLDEESERTEPLIRSKPGLKPVGRFSSLNDIPWPPTTPRIPRETYLTEAIVVDVASHPFASEPIPVTRADLSLDAPSDPEPSNAASSTEEIPLQRVELSPPTPHGLPEQSNWPRPTRPRALSNNSPALPVTPARAPLGRRNASTAADEPPHSELPWSHVVRTDAYLQAISRQADEIVQHGCVLAQRGAFYSARCEFISALRLLTEALDSRCETPYHQASLANGLQALNELEDFSPTRLAASASARLEIIASAHRTPVLHDLQDLTISPQRAAELYSDYAREQLAAAADGAPVASMALFGLGKLQRSISPGGGNSHVTWAWQLQTLALYQASLMTDEQNFLASAALGSIYAGYGRYGEAASLLERSLAVSPQPSMWKHLASLYAALGDERRAKQASAQAQKDSAAQGGNGGSKYPIAWVTPQTFAESRIPEIATDPRVRSQSSLPLRTGIQETTRARSRGEASR